MLFNSYAFLFVFLPLALLSFYGLRAAGRLRASVVLLAMASVAFYAYWKPADTFILLGTIVFNFLCARFLSSVAPRRAGWVLLLGVAGNLGLLVYFKYFDFLATNISALLGAHFSPRGIVMPIGISFFTFTQIAYLVDCYRSRTHEAQFDSYALFVTIFPHLIAGPIIHHAQMRPQFARLRTERIASEMALLGIVIFVLGLAKKVLIADNLVGGADAIFNAADAGARLTAAAAWTGAIAYTLQIYFDFSGYSDMAVGLGLLFGLRLPVNFNSPYKATSIIDFWRRWHITLSAWLRDYLYIPLGGNRQGEFGRLRNVFVTFLLGGIWHGAGWTFVIWGALHGAYVVGNHLARAAFPRHETTRPGALVAACQQAFTLALVIIAWIFFRAKTVPGAVSLLASMGFAGAGSTRVSGLDNSLAFWMTVAGALALFVPNTQGLTGYTANLGEPLRLRSASFIESLRARTALLGATPATAVICGILFAAALACIWRPAIFIYFNF